MSKQKAKRQNTDYAHFVEVTAKSATAQEAANALDMSIQRYRTKAYQLRKHGVKNLKRFPRKTRINYQELDELAQKLDNNSEKKGIIT